MRAIIAVQPAIEQSKANVIVGGIFIGGAFGLVVSLVASLFVIGVKAITNFREGHLDSLAYLDVYGFSAAPVPFILCAAIIVIVIKRSFGISRWHGPADSIYAAHRTDNELDVKSGLGSTLAAFVSASGGASVGQYGPLVHFGATIGSYLKEKFGSYHHTDVFIGCGVAAAISAGFHAPIAGIIFAHEAILRHFSTRAIVPITTASISAAWFSINIFDGNALFDLATIQPDLKLILPVVMIFGPIFGLVATLFMVCIRQFSRFSASNKFSFETNIVTAALITGFVGIFLPEVLGLGTSSLSRILNAEFSLLFLISLGAAKLLLSALCVGFGLFGGIFSPALFVGAAVGAALGAALSLFFPESYLVTPLAICGMAAVSGAVIGAPMAAVIIILEMTLNYQLAIVAMLGTVLSLAVSNGIFGHSFFDRQLLDRGIDISQGRGQLLLLELRVRDFVKSDYVCLKPEMSPKTAMEELIHHQMSEGYIVSPEGKLIGKITMPSLLAANPEIAIEAISEKKPIFIKHDASLLQAIEVASSFVGESIPIVVSDTRQMVGIVTEADLFQLYLSTQSKVKDLERA